MSEFLNPRRAKQLIDFDGLSYGTIYPTDIDGVIEYKDIGYIFYEVKYGDKDVPFGQKLALERLVKDTYKGNKKSLAIIAEHNIDNPETNVILADCNIREIYTAKKNIWRHPEDKTTVKELSDIFIKKLIV